MNSRHGMSTTDKDLDSIWTLQDDMIIDLEYQNRVERAITRQYQFESEINIEVESI